MLLILQLSVVVADLVVILLLATPIPTAAQALPGCQDHCGNLSIPYPFGIGPGCYLQPQFNITCNQSSQHPKVQLLTSNIIITNFSIEEGELQILQYVAEDCYDAQGNPTGRNVPRLWVPPPYTISHTKNKFYALGCDTYSFFSGYREDQKFTTGCMSICDSLDNAVDGQNTCSGVGCCQTSIPSGLKNQTVTLKSFRNHTGIWDFNPCSYSFIVQDGQFEFNGTSFQQLNNRTLLPAALNWEIGNQSCDAAQKSEGFACKGNSNCTTVGSAGYICKCMPGYHGNPYHPDGCQDIDECENSNACSIGKCINSLGNYSCKCPKGYKNDGMNEKTCIKDNNRSKIILLLGISLGFLLLVVGSLWIYWGMQKRKFIKLKEKYFKENGGLLLKQQLASQGGSMETTKLFTAEELEKATNNYHESRILGEGGYGTVYKGILPDKSVVAIKKSKVNGAPAQSDVFINEVIVLSQIKHRNVVRLLGCCLETPAPLLVYEFIVEGTLSEHIHKKIGKRSSLSWELRLNIATETAGALAYLHSSALMQIIHRDVKATNILLDEHYTAKVSDFGASRLIPLDQTQLTTLVQGTFGYLDPEYFLTNQLTEKSDVYSFGVVLMELLTSKVALSFARPEEDRNLANFFVRFMEEDRLNEVLDDDIVNERNVETLKKVAEVAKRCVRLKGQDRPSMKEVAMELEGMRVTPKQPWGKSEVSSPEDTEYLLGSAMNSDAYFVDVRGDFGSRGATIGTTSGYDSIQIQMVMPYDGR
ncbi:PREDICTED: putative wall-associated receptor kinase-like 16 [Prunus mume]|uniref:Wall-associated receptor kinase-like 16 n=1 Tax=Prunus mume TaxID=102107 RepID=A0ABM1LLA2_PRUMU|nr:PREDICTED: putative wall-associated receptor kinase-like 16 [Prunus mume]